MNFRLYNDSRNAVCDDGETTDRYLKAQELAWMKYRTKFMKEWWRMILQICC